MQFGMENGVAIQGKKILKICLLGLNLVLSVQSIHYEMS